MNFEWDEAKSSQCFEHRGFAIRIISARKANLREVNDYENGAFQT